MLSLSFATDDASFSVLGSNVEHVADFGSTQQMAFTRYYASGNSNVGYVVGVSNVDEGPTPSSLFMISELVPDTNDANVVFSLFDGKVGIGSILNPTTQLDVDGSVTVRQQLVISTTANDAPPISLTSSVLNTNLNADLLDGQEGSYYRTATNINAGTLSVAHGGTGVSSPTAGAFLVGNGSSAMVQPSLLRWDNTNGRLGVGTQSPASGARLHVDGNVLVTGGLFYVDKGSGAVSLEDSIATSLSNTFSPQIDGKVSKAGDTIDGNLSITSNLTVSGRVTLGGSTSGSGPFVQQSAWLPAASNHTIAFEDYARGQNSAGTLHIQVSNQSTVTPKLGNLTVSFLKAYGNGVAIFLVSKHTTSTLSVCSVSTSTTDIVVSCDSDCKICWTSIGAF